MTTAAKFSKYLRLNIFKYLDIEKDVLTKISSLNRATRALIQNSVIFYEGKSIDFDHWSKRVSPDHCLLMDEIPDKIIKRLDFLLSLVEYVEFRPVCLFYNLRPAVARFICERLPKRFHNGRVSLCWFISLHPDNHDEVNQEFEILSQCQDLVLNRVLLLTDDLRLEEDFDKDLPCLNSAFLLTRVKVLNFTCGGELRFKVVTSPQRTHMQSLKIDDWTFFDT